MDINFSDLIKEKVYSGREEGKELRQILKLSELDKTDEIINIIIPIDIYSATIGFVLALFGDSIRTLGSDDFYDKYKFQCSDVMRESIMNDLKSALKRELIL